MAVSNYLKFKWGPFLAAFATLPIFHYASIEFIRDNSEYFVKDRTDLRGRQSQMLVQDQVGHQPTAYFVGGSGMMWSLPAETEVSGPHGQPMRIRNYAYGFQTILESYVLLKQIPLRRGDIVFVHISPSRVNRSLVEERLFCRPYFYTVMAADIISAYKEFGFDAQINPLCHLSFLSRSELVAKIATQRILNHFPTRFMSHIPQRFELSPGLLENKRGNVLRTQLWSARKDFHARWLEMDASQVGEALQMLARIRGYVERRGARLVLADLPLNRSWFERHFDWGRSKEEAYQRLGAELRSAGYEYHDWRWVALFHDGDFYDHQHMLESGRKKIFPIYQSAILGVID